MAILQQNSSRLSAFLFGQLALMIGMSAQAQITYPDRTAPAKGDFDWKKFEGKYDFSECQSRPSAIWGDSPPGTFVQIEYKVDYMRNPIADGLELMRANNRNPIALGWFIEHVGRGHQIEIDVHTGKIGKVMESFATVDGVYSMMAWDRPHNVGWSTLQLRMDAKSNISLTILQRTDSDTTTREETCTLKRYVPTILLKQHAVARIAAWPENRTTRASDGGLSHLASRHDQTLTYQPATIPPHSAPTSQQKPRIALPCRLVILAFAPF